MVSPTRHPLDHPSMAEFVSQLDAVNELARRNPYFVWMPDGDEAGNAAAIFRSDRALPNLSVWLSFEELRRFVYEGQHGQALARRREWFETPNGPAYALWWTSTDVRPTLADGKNRLAHLAANGPTPYAFNFTKPFPPDAI